MSCFSGVLNQSDAFASLNRAWTTGSRPVGAVGLSETGKALVLHALYEQQKKPLLVLTPDEASAVKLTEDLRTLQGDVLLYPAREMNFVQVAGASHEYELLRLDVLSRMAAGAYTAVVAPMAAACQLTMPVLTPAFLARSDLARTIPCRSSTEPHTAIAFPFREGSNIISTEA